MNIFLPNGFVFPGVTVTIGDWAEDADVLIGMNIIVRGDFAVTNLDGITKFSFRIPSQVHIDFVEEGERELAVPQSQHGVTNKRRTKRPKRAKNRRS